MRIRNKHGVKSALLVVSASLVVVGIVPVAAMRIGMGAVVPLSSPVVAVARVTVARIAVAEVAVARVAIGIALSVVLPPSALYVVDVVAHLPSVRRSAVLSSIAEAPVHLHTNGSSVDLQTAQEIDGILRDSVRFKTTDHPASRRPHHEAESAGLMCVFVNAHNHLLHGAATTEEAVDPLFGSVEGNVADVHGARLLDRFQLVIQR